MAELDLLAVLDKDSGFCLLDMGLQDHKNGREEIWLDNILIANMTTVLHEDLFVTESLILESRNKITS